MNYDEQLRSISYLIQAANFPIYGLVNHPLDLSICSFGCGRTGFTPILSSVTFTFSSPHYPEKRENFEICSADTTFEHQQKILHGVENSPEDPRFELGLDTYVFRSYDLRSEEQANAGPPFIWEGVISLAGIPFSGKIRNWSHPRQLSRFRLKTDTSELSGRAYGLSLEELLFLLRSLEVINQQENLIKEYQREFDQEDERLFGKRG